MARGPRSPRGRSAPRRGKLRSEAPRAGTATPGSATGRGAGGEAPLWGSRGGTEQADRSPRPGPGRPRRGAVRRDGGRGLRRQEGTASPAQVPAGSRAYRGSSSPAAPGSSTPAGPPPLPAVGAPAPSAGGLRGQPRPPTGGRARRGAVRGCGALSPRPLPGCGLRAIVVCRGLDGAFLPG